MTIASQSHFKRQGALDERRRVLDIIEELVEQDPASADYVDTEVLRRLINEEGRP